MVMYELTDAGRALLGAVIAGAVPRMSAPSSCRSRRPAPRAPASTHAERYRELAARVRLLSWLSPRLR